jgi:hypothetical protein
MNWKLPGGRLDPNAISCFRLFNEIRDTILTIYSSGLPGHGDRGIDLRRMCDDQHLLRVFRPLNLASFGGFYNQILCFYASRKVNLCYDLSYITEDLDALRKAWFC